MAVEFIEGGDEPMTPEVAEAMKTSLGMEVPAERIQGAPPAEEPAQEVKADEQGDEKGPTVKEESVNKEETQEASEAATETESDKAADSETHRRFADMSRKEREIRKLSKELNEVRTTKDAWEKEKQELLAKINGYEETFTKARENPLDLLQKAGMDYEYLTERILNDDKPTTDHKVGALERKLAELEQAQLSWKEEMAKKEQELQQKQYEAQVQQFYSDVGKFVKGSDKYELSAHFGDPAVNQIVDTIGKVYEDSERALSYDEAAELVEEAYVKDIESLLSVGKVKQLIEKKFGISLNGTARPATTATEAGKEKEETSKTLTNGMASTPTQSSDGEPATDEERIARAVQHLRWK